MHVKGKSLAPDEVSTFDWYFRHDDSGGGLPKRRRVLVSIQGSNMFLWPRPGRPFSSALESILREPNNIVFP